MNGHSSRPSLELKILLTSRPDPDISTQLKRFPCFDLRAHEEDLEIFVNKMVSDLPRQFDRLQDKAAELLLAGAGRSFLWVSIIMKEIKRIRFPSVAELQETIRSSPTDLNTLYSGIFDKIMGSSVIEQKLVAYDRQPLTFKELETAVSIQANSKSQASTQDYMVNLTSELLTSALGIILESIDGVIHLIHQSAKDYMLQKNMFANCSFCNDIGPQLFISKACMSYLGFDDIKLDLNKPNQEISVWELQFRLLGYAARNWHAHIRNEGEAQFVPELFHQILGQSSSLEMWCEVTRIVAPPFHSLKFATNANIE